MTTPYEPHFPDYRIIPTGCDHHAINCDMRSFSEIVFAKCEICGCEIDSSAWIQEKTMTVRERNLRLEKELNNMNLGLSRDL